MIDPKSLLDLMLRALESAPVPVAGEVSSVHPEDLRKWSERYKIWYQDIRCHILNELADDPKDNVYYQIDRLIQEAKAIQHELANICDTTEPAKPARTGNSIVIGNIKKTS